MCWRRLKGGVFCCSLLLAGAGEAQTLFEDVTEEAMQRVSTTMFFHGCACGDYDQDGRPDLFADELEGQSRILLLHNEDSKGFTDRTRDIRATISRKYKGAGTLFGDYDNDGDPDLFLPVGWAFWSTRDRDALLRNEYGVFRDVSLEAGLADTLPTMSALWLDYDRDGYLDLFRGSVWNTGEGVPPEVARKGYSRLHRNNGDGTFTEVTTEAGVGVQGVEGFSGLGPMLAGDFSGDGWPDLYLGLYQLPNIFFLNTGHGSFQNATTAEIAHPGHADGVVAGDIDNDGDLDLFLVNAEYLGQDRHAMYLNIEGDFLDVTDNVGLGGLTGLGLISPALLDVDNDGDLDMFAAINPGNDRVLYLNQGEGIFVDATSQAGLERAREIDDLGFFACWLDYDLDGFLDVVFSNRTWYRNLGNDHHWLRVELVGAKSNRDGIGARLIATSGDLRQVREVFGGDGYSQDERVAHFGLGQRTQVDRLEVRWPSGQVDVLTDIPTDQKIRIIEGRGAYYPMVPTQWVAVPDTLIVDSLAKVALTVQSALFEPTAEITAVFADLSALGGPEAVPLQAAGDGAYRLEPRSLAIEGPNGFRTLSIMIDQTTSLGPYWTRLSRQVPVVPAGDLVVFDEALAQDWQIESSRRIKRLELSETGVVHRGSLAGAFEAEEGLWTVTFKPAVPVSVVGYTALHFALHLGSIVPPSGVGYFSVALKPAVASDFLKKGWVEIEKKEWQAVEVPLGELGIGTPIEAVVFTGNFAGTFYLDDIRLVAVSPPPLTVVEEERTTALPQSFTLSQNFPNPFNSQTVIRFELPEGGEVELAVYNLAGQQVAKLVEGTREAGSYTLRWDGRDGRG
ncbi:MAG: VCBS repeat-containing protein, partial [Candidatus Latescibacteria bacterium]|nr:VCBS repeat-containing protein [Candidatus Latescibacterota bacterium]